MNMNEFESKWAELASGGHSAGRFRVYPDHTLNFYVQYSLAGYREVVIDVLGEDMQPFELPAFRNIELVSLKTDNGIRIGMTLLEADLARNFSLMCYDLAERSGVACSVDAATAILLRALANWAELFKRRANDGLTREEVLGLMGELLVLESLLTESEINPNTLILGWRGPNGDTRDIGVNGTRVEVKAQLSTGALKLRISSLTQLDDCGDRVFVALMRVSPSEKGRSLLTIVEDIKELLIGRPLAGLEFERKIALSGMTVDSNQCLEEYALDDRIVYSVTGSFPRLTPANVPLGIAAVQYEIAGPSLDACRTDWAVLLGAVDG
ncbi:PD-(D/E)XK motif protein [Deefgea rivuli]|uniref:PD-(D/E)XK motif protein n=1 Tax=Deefgea rivuli TaxID=400948 RepID=UPI000483DAD1|nr:PD-(D/E)XK motif protein [Deefgea rivuli]